MTTLEKLVDGATKIKMAPPKPKYMEPILMSTSEGLRSDDFQSVMKSLRRRLNDSAWTIVYKSLIVIHIMIREGEENVTLEYLKQHTDIFNVKIGANGKFIDNGGSIRQIKAYAAYLQVKSREYGKSDHDFIKETKKPFGSWEVGDKNSILRDLSVEKGLLRETESVERLIQALIKCRFQEHEVNNDVVILSFRMLTADLISLYQTLNEGVLNLLEHFFELSKPDAVRAYDIYVVFTKLTEQVVSFLRTAKHLEKLTKCGVPTIKHAQTSLGDSLREYIEDPDFDITRRQYLAEKDYVKSNGKSSGNARNKQKSSPQQVSSPTKSNQAPQQIQAPQQQQQQQNEINRDSLVFQQTGFNPFANFNPQGVVPVIVPQFTMQDQQQMFNQAAQLQQQQQVAQLQQQAAQEEAFRQQQAAQEEAFRQQQAAAQQAAAQQAAQEEAMRQQQAAQQAAQEEAMRQQQAAQKAAQEEAARQQAVALAQQQSLMLQQQALQQQFTNQPAFTNQPSQFTNQPAQFSNQQIVPPPQQLQQQHTLHYTAPNGFNTLPQITENSIQQSVPQPASALQFTNTGNIPMPQRANSVQNNHNPFFLTQTSTGSNNPFGANTSFSSPQKDLSIKPMKLSKVKSGTNPFRLETDTTAADKVQPGVIQPLQRNYTAGGLENLQTIPVFPETQRDAHVKSVNPFSAQPTGFQNTGFQQQPQTTGFQQQPQTTGFQQQPQTTGFQQQVPLQNTGFQQQPQFQQQTTGFNQQPSGFHPNFQQTAGFPQQQFQANQFTGSTYRGPNLLD